LAPEKYGWHQPRHISTDCLEKSLLKPKKRLLPRKPSSMGHICLRIELLGEKATKRRPRVQRDLICKVDSRRFTSMGHTTKNILTWKNDLKNRLQV
jgi:hypothetical protein